LKAPNKCIKGKREGLWAEFNFCDTIDFEGNYHGVYGQHETMKTLVAEGNYVHNQKQGFWKQY
jgi:hypothetical protein